MISRFASFYPKSRKCAALVAIAAVVVCATWLTAAPDLAMAQVSALKNHDTSQAIDITADRLEVREKENIAVFSGSVEAVQGDMQISADSVTVYYEKAAGGGNPIISRLDLAGSAKLVSPSEVAESEWAIYDVEARLLTLGGSVVLTRGDSVLRGDRLELDLESGVTKFESTPVAGAGAPDAAENVPSGRVRGRFSVPGQGEDDSEEEKSQEEENNN